MKVELKRKDVADRFDCNLENDITVHTKGYSGKISNINMAGAEHILRDKNVFYLTEKTSKKEEKPAGKDKATPAT